MWGAMEIVEMPCLCPKCGRLVFTLTLCACLASGSLPAEREHIPVPDQSRVADEPPHVENEAKVATLREPYRASHTASTTLSAGALTLADGTIITSGARPPPITFTVWRSIR